MDIIIGDVKLSCQKCQVEVTARSVIWYRFLYTFRLNGRLSMWNAQVHVSHVYRLVVAIVEGRNKGGEGESREEKKKNGG